MVASFLDLAVHRHVIVGYVLSKYFRKSVIMHACINKFKKKLYTDDNDGGIHLWYRTMCPEANTIISNLIYACAWRKFKLIIETSLTFFGRGWKCKLIINLISVFKYIYVQHIPSWLWIIIKNMNLQWKL